MPEDTCTLEEREDLLKDTSSESNKESVLEQQTKEEVLIEKNNSNNVNLAEEKEEKKQEIEVEVEVEVEDPRRRRRRSSASS